MEGDLLRVKYKGWDFTEIGEPLGIKVPDGMLDDSAYIQEWLWDNGWETHFEPKKAVIKECRKFLKALSKAKNYEQPMWKGILAIKDNFSFMRFFINNLPYMWN